MVNMGYSRNQIDESLSMHRYDEIFAVYHLLGLKQTEVSIVFQHNFLASSHMYPENAEGTRVIVGSMNMGYVFCIQHCQDSN